MENGRANSVRNAVTQEFGPVPDTARYYKVRPSCGVGMGVSGASWWPGRALHSGKGGPHLQLCSGMMSQRHEAAVSVTPAALSFGSQEGHTFQTLRTARPCLILSSESLAGAGFSSNFTCPWGADEAGGSGPLTCEP